MNSPNTGSTDHQEDQQTKSSCVTAFLSLPHRHLRSLSPVVARPLSSEELGLVQCAALLKSAFPLFQEFSFSHQSSVQMKCVGAEDGSQPCQRCRRTGVEYVFPSSRLAQFLSLPIDVCSRDTDAAESQAQSPFDFHS